MEKSTTSITLKALTVSIVTLLLVSSSVGGRKEWHCGRTVETMRNICDGCYWSPSQRDVQMKVEVHRPFINKREANVFAKSVPSMVKRGLLEECCYTRCDLQHMMTYCCEERQREYSEFIALFKDTSSDTLTTS
ncbi:insulin-like [Glandiceps talaboti]